MEDQEFCGAVTWAAKRLGFLLMDCKDHFVWFDSMTGGFIPGPKNEDQKQALKGACESLVNHIHVPAKSNG